MSTNTAATMPLFTTWNDDEGLAATIGRLVDEHGRTAVIDAVAEAIGPDAQWPARTTDRTTSQTGAARVASRQITPSSTAGLVLLELSRMRRATAMEVATAVADGNHSRVETARKRVSELNNSGLIREVFVRECDVTGQPATEWELTPSWGVNAVNDLLEGEPTARPTP